MSIEKIKQLREMTGAGMMDVKKALDASKGNIDEAVKWLRVNGIAKAAKKSGRIAAEGSIFIGNNSKKVVMMEMNSETDFVSSNDKFKSESNKIIDAILNSEVKSGDLDSVFKLKVDGSTIELVLANMTSTIGEKISLRRFVSYDLQKNNVGIYKHSNNQIGAIVLGESIDNEVLRDVSMHVVAMNPDFLTKEEISNDIVKKETELAKKELEETLKGKPDNIKENIIKGKVNKVLSDGVLLEQQFVKDSSKKVKDLEKGGKFKSFIRFEVGEGIQKKEENFAEEVAKQIKK